MPLVTRDDAPEVVALLPTMLGNPDRLRACVDSLRALAGDVRMAVLCIVNSSTADPTPASDLGIEVEVAGINLGWAGGLEFGLSLTSSEFVWFVQDDMECEPDALVELLAALRADPSLGLVSPIVVGADGLVAPASLGGYIDDDGEISQWIPSTAIAASELGSLAAPDYVPSRGMLLRRSALERVGPPDARMYPVQFVDVDLCLRLKAVGLGVRIVSSAVVRHGGKGSTPQGFAEFLNTRNSMRVHAKHFSDRRLPGDRFFPVVALRPDPPEAAHHALHPHLPSAIVTAVAQSAADTLTHLARVFTLSRGDAAAALEASLAQTDEAREQVRLAEERGAQADERLALADERLAEAHRQREASDIRLDELEQAIERERQWSSDLQVRLAAVEASTSWRVTAPLRWLRDRVRR